MRNEIVLDVTVKLYGSHALLQYKLKSVIIIKSHFEYIDIPVENKALKCHLILFQKSQLFLVLHLRE